MVHVFPSSTDSTRKKGGSMSSEELKADAWASFSDSYRVMDDLDAHEEYVIVDDDTHKEPLYSAETIQEEMEGIRNQLHYVLAHSDLEKSLQTRLETAIEKTEVFSSHEQ